MSPLTSIKEIRSVLPSRLDSGQQQRLPFNQGQFLYATISAKEGVHQFTLDINGQQFTAHSNASLQVGQQLNLQVVSLTPQIELQIVTSDAINRQIGNLLPFLTQQSTLATELSALADSSDLMQQLSPTSRETILLYSEERIGFVPNLQNPSPLQITENNTLRGQTGMMQPISTAQKQVQAAGDLFHQLTQDPSLPANTGQLAADLADFFAQTATQEDAPTVLQFLSRTTLPNSATINELINLVVEKIQQNPTPNLSTVATLLPLMTEINGLPAANRLQNLLFLLTNSDSGQQHLPAQGNGSQLSEHLSRLGLNLERLLLESRSEEAARTLKFALMEAAQLGGINEQNRFSTDRLVQNLELYQLLQLKLADASLFFLPLPLSFLQQGYLLIDRDRSSVHEEETEQEKGGHSGHAVTLHLQLEGLGNLQIDIHRSESRLNLRFLTEQTEQAKYLAAFREELEHWLTNGTLASAQFLVGAKEPLRALLAVALGDTASMIDTNV